MAAWWNLTTVDTKRIELVVARRMGKDGIAPATIPINRDVGDELRGIVTDIVDRMNEDKLAGRQWSAETSWETDEYQIVSRDKLDPDNPVLTALESTAIPDMSPENLRDPSLLLYAIVAGSGDNRLLFIRKTNPRYSAETRVFAILGDEHLSRIEQPLFSFDRRCDMILVPGRGLIAFTENPFDQLFRDSPVLQAKVTASASGLAPNLMTKDSADVLAAAATKWARIRRRVLAINERKHLSKVTSHELKQELRRLGYDPNHYITGGKLDITDSNVQDVVRVLNEDLFKGGLSKERFEAERKRPI
ncbi:hypothetical protein [Micromonospora sp. CPCC 206061]|uniref:hypothetical protein n=1 Tax=Micromonospora sp. CPCC 206061 TaxID=3122410 RepID=UPI002FF02D6D